MGAEMAGMATQGLGILGEQFGAIQSFEEGKKQGKQLIHEAEQETQALERENKKFMAQQESAYLKSGVTLEGSPLLVLEETRQLGLAERQNIRSAARSKADSIYRQGRNRLMGAFLFPSGGGKMTEQMAGANWGSPKKASTGYSEVNRQTFAGSRQYVTNEGY